VVSSAALSQVLAVLFRRKPAAVVAFLERRGDTPYRDFVRQIGSHSVMEALKILVLPAVQVRLWDR
jgi:hypothetical protein